MRHCPQCGEGLNEGVCPGCGYGQRKTKSGPVDPYRGTCENVERGLRCSAPGVYTSSTFGVGPWFCPTHFPPTYGDDRSTARPAPVPSSASLTDAQWYAVCKFFPSIAARAKRRVVPVGPEQPLDRQVRLGPLLGGWRPPVPEIDLEAIAEREALQAPDV